MTERDKEYYNQKISELYSVVENQEKIIRDYQEELQKADSITQSCLFEGMEESTINFRECLKALENYKQRIDKAVEYIENKEIDTLHFNSKDFLDTSIAGELLEILKGGNNE